jgi:mannose-6-phosphate isomerase-like protein (cupin superfamily)
MMTPALAHTIGSGDLRRRRSGSVAFEGKDYGSGVSIYLVELTKVGAGPKLHKHPYAETWIIRGGNARFTVAGETVEASAGEILVGPAEVPHKFENLGPDALDIICIHPSDRFIQEDLEP